MVLDSHSLMLSSHSHLRKFLIVLVPLLALPVLAALMSSTFRGHDWVDLSALGENEVYVPIGTTQQQNVAIKIGFAEHSGPPTVGIFGAHQAQNFGARHFDRPGESVFNYFFLVKPSLQEIRDFLFYLRSIDKLPSELVVVHVFTPAYQWGRRFVVFQGANPPDVTLSAAPLYTTAADRWDFFDGAVRALVQRLKSVFQYQNILVGLLGGGGKALPLDMGRCRAAMADAAQTIPAWRLALLRILPASVLINLGWLDVEDLCRAQPLLQYLDYSIFRDGQVLYTPWLAGAPAAPFRDTESRDRLRLGDDRLMARYLSEIRDIVERDGRRLVFYIPPANRTYAPTIVDEIMDRTLALIPDIAVIDHRARGMSSGDFIDKMHMSSAYFDSLVAEMRQRGVLRPK